ncbi:hypothetical protein COCVIDRAFT_95653, partial [Bipolaris victoriae FI3]
MVTIIWYSSRCSRRGLLLFFRYAVCSVQARRDLGVAGRFPKFKPRSNVRWCKRALELRPFAHDQNDVRRSQRHERSSGDPLPETPSCVSHLAGIPDRNIDKLKNIRRRRGDERSKASIQSNTASVPRHQPYGRHRIRTKLRQLVPASSAPNSSVLENQQQEYERQILLSSRSKRTASRVDGAFAFLAQTPLPCSAGQPSSSHHQSYMLPMDPGRRHPFQQHDVSYGNMPAGSGDSRLSQPRAVTGFNVAPAPPPASFSQP